MIKIKTSFKNNLVKEIKSFTEKKIDKIKKSLEESLKENTPKDTGYAASRWRIKENSIINDAEYISFLNEGTSKQAPKYFIERTILNKPGITPSGVIVKKL